jgi:hypothetical protein
MMPFPVVHRVVLLPLPQSEIAGVVAMVVVVPEHQLVVLMVVPEHEVVVVRLAEHQVVVVVRVAEDEVVVAEVEPVVVVMVLPEVVVALPQRQLGRVLPVPQDQLVVGHHQSPPSYNSAGCCCWSKQTIKSDTIRGEEEEEIKNSLEISSLSHNSTKMNR